MSRKQNNDTDTLTGKTLVLKQASYFGEMQSRVEDITEWDMTTTEDKEYIRKIGKNQTMKGTISTYVDLWQRYLEDSTGFYFVDCEISFYPNDKTTSAGKNKRYWYAAKRIDGKLHRVYAGASKKLTYEKIVKVSEELLAKVEGKK